MSVYGWKNEETLRAAIWYRDCQPPGEAMKSLEPEKLGEVLKMLHVQALSEIKEKGLYVVLIEVALNKIDWTQIGRFLINDSA